MKEERIPKKGFNGEFLNTRPVGRPKQMGGYCSEGCTTDARDTRMEEMS